MTRDELRAALAALDVERAEVEEAARPAREALKPFLDRIDGILKRRDELFDHHEVAGLCDDCGLVLIAGDEGFKYADNDVLLCRECAPTLGEAIENLDTDDDDFAESRAALAKRIEAEGADVKLTWPL